MAQFNYTNSASPVYGPRYTGPYLDTGFIDPYLVEFTNELTIDVWKLKGDDVPLTRWSPREKLMIRLNYNAIRFMSTWNCDKPDFKLRSQLFVIDGLEYEIVLGFYRIFIHRRVQLETITFELDHFNFLDFKDWLETSVQLIEGYLHDNNLVDVMPMDPGDFDVTGFPDMFNDLHIQ